MSIEKRSKFIIKLSEGIEKRMDEFVNAESLDNGKPIALAAQVDIPRAVSNFHFFATAIIHFASESHALEGQGINYTTRKPIGVGCISLESTPVFVFMEDCSGIGPGNCVIAKPSRFSIYGVLAFRIAQEIGLPPLTSFMEQEMLLSASIDKGDFIHRRCKRGPYFKNCRADV